ncbi:MAG: hypothetical protein HQL18_03370, partial [Candidatus Omnitrophica bacterium]|nr:hypothetical protein [Candidatus Omnitrophota bacterium]
MKTVAPEKADNSGPLPGMSGAEAKAPVGAAAADRAARREAYSLGLQERQGGLRDASVKRAKRIASSPKFSHDGKVKAMPFRGTTVIAFVPKNSTLFTRLKAAQERMRAAVEAAGLSRFVAWLKPE